jgi:uncharacterized protein YegP (UPF0339 family)
MRGFLARLISKSVAPEPDLACREEGAFHVYPSKDGFRWRLVTANNRIVAESGEAYTRERDAERAARRAAAVAMAAPIVRIKGE